MDATFADGRQGVRRRDRGRLHGHRGVGLPESGGTGAGMKLDARIPAGPVAAKWDRHKFEMKLVNPNNKRKFKVIMVGTGLAGASAG